MSFGSCSFTNSHSIYPDKQNKKCQGIEVTENRVYINDKYYNQEEFCNLLEQAIEIQGESKENINKRSAGAVVKAESWLYNKITS